MKTVFIIFCTLLVISIAVAGIIFFVSPKDTILSDKEKKVAFTKILGRAPILTEKIRSNAFTQYRGKYMTFVYPIAAKQYPSDEKIDNTTVVEHFQFQETDNPRYHFFTQVEMLHATSLQYDDIPSVRLRRTQPTLYIEGRDAIYPKGTSHFVMAPRVSTDNGSWITFTKKEDAFEKTGFLLSGGKLYMLSIIGSDPAIEKIFDRVVESVSIKNYQL